MLIMLFSLFQFIYYAHLLDVDLRRRARI